MLSPPPQKQIAVKLQVITCFNVRVLHRIRIPLFLMRIPPGALSSGVWLWNPHAGRCLFSGFSRIAFILSFGWKWKNCPCGFSAEGFFSFIFIRFFRFFPTIAGDVGLYASFHWHIARHIADFPVHIIPFPKSRNGCVH